MCCSSEMSTMPQRTNAFQDLIALLERQLAPSGSLVFESKLLRDVHTGEDREVDIVIEAKVGMHAFLIGIEVIDHGRPASSPWIESIAQKHQDLPINKSIVVSRSGFYQPALLKAKAKKIDTLTIDQALSSDWKAKIDGMTFIDIQSFLLPYLTDAKILFDNEDALNECQGPDLAGLLLYRDTGECRGTVQSVLEQFLARPDVRNEIFARAFTDAATSVKGEVRLRGSYVLGADGRKYLVNGVEFIAKCKKELHSATLQKGRYGDRAVVLASGESMGHPVSIAVSESLGADPVVSVRIGKTPTK